MDSSAPPPAAAGPIATYRLQIAPDLPLAAARALVGYLDRLGVDTLYGSPVFEARPGSAHGYDVTDPRRVRAELGGEAELDRLADELHRRGMGLLLDLVPNHMAAHPANPWWRDVLLHGPRAAAARFFDVDWAKGGGKLLVPILGAPYGEELEAGRLVVVPRSPDEPGGPAVLRYYDTELPLAPGSLDGVDRAAAAAGEPAAVDRVVARQAYRPAHWRLAAEGINYRRFFDIAELAAVRVEDPEVFAATHEAALRLVAEGRVTGLRIDHVDGLHDPRGYLERLRAAVGPGVYLVVEKILAGDEELPAEWPVEGTTGYEFLNSLTGLFVDPRGLADLDRLYARFTGQTAPFAEVRYRRKKQALAELFPGEVAALGRRLAALAAEDRVARDLPPSDLERALVEVTACLPVYRTYLRAAEGGAVEVRREDRETIARAVAEARERAARRPLDHRALAFVEGVLTVEPPEHVEDREAARRRRAAFVQRWQQLTGPAMAKGLEDTALYVYNRLISLNAVGGEPEGIDPPGDAAAFHRRNALRLERHPRSMTASTTHDAKRSEDVRARVNVLSELADDWGRRVRRWTGWNRRAKPEVGGRLVPDPNEEIFLYQTLIGAWPLDEEDADGGEGSFRARLHEYLTKALREAKVHTSWLEPDEAYERGVHRFLDRILDPEGVNPFLDDLLGLVSRVAVLGAWGSLAQVVLSVASPGVPDTYQGTELWSFHLVDPDNRRPVDWELRRRLLDELDRRAGDAAARPALLAELLDGWRDGRVKLYTTSRALRLRRAHPELFLAGRYLPIEPAGAHADHVVAFARRLPGEGGRPDRWALAAVPRWLARLAPDGRPPVGSEIWADTALPLPEGAPTAWTDAFTGETVRATDGTLPAAVVFARFPVALLVSGATSSPGGRGS